MNLLRDGNLWLHRQQQDYASSPIVYHRGADSFALKAVYALTQNEDIDTNGIPFTIRIHDFIVQKRDLGFEPDVMDQIEAFGVMYQVKNFAFDGCYRYTDPTRSAMRIHTQVIDTQSEDQQIESV